MAAVIAIVPFIYHKPHREDWLVASLLLVIGGMGIRKARQLNHN